MITCILLFIIIFVVVTSCICLNRPKGRVYVCREIEENQSPVDIVITWVDSSDVKWQKEKEYYSSGDEGGGNSVLRFPDERFPDLELRACILFILKNIKWRRNIYIVTSDGMVPNCYHDLIKIDKNIRIVYHSDMWPKKLLHTLPTFNSRAIECNIHRIKGLTANFIYFNDDMYVVKELNYHSMFCNDKMIIQPLEFFPSLLLWGRRNIWNVSWNKMYKLYGMKPPKHVFFALNKNTMRVAENSIYDKWEETMCSRFRKVTDIPPVGYTLNFALQHELGYTPSQALKLGLHNNSKTAFNSRNRNVDVICINKSSSVSTSVQNLMDSYLFL